MWGWRSLLGKYKYKRSLAQSHMKTNDIKWVQGRRKGLDHARPKGNAE